MRLLGVTYLFTGGLTNEASDIEWLDCSTICLRRGPAKSIFYYSEVFSLSNFLLSSLQIGGQV